MALLASAGCMHRHVSHNTSGCEINMEGFGRITEGKTPAAWVEGVMGKPSSTKKVDETTEIWTWTGDDQKTVDAEFLVISDKSRVTEHTTAIVEIKNGIVTKKWVDSYTVKNEERTN